MRRLLLGLVLIALVGNLAPLAAQDDSTLRLAVIPVLDTLPLYIAEQNAYFEEAGVDVEFIPVASPVERDQLIVTGEADGMITDVPGVALFNQDETRVQIVYTTRVSLPEGPIFRLLAAPNSDITSPADLAGVPIGVSEGTIIEYLTFRMLEAEGVSDIATEPVPAIPVRFQLLMAGELKAATLPDPLAQAAIQLGAKLITDDSQFAESEIAQSVLVFSAKFIDENPELVSGFILAWDKAVAELNADPEAYRALFLERVQVPEPVQATYAIPAFPQALITSESVWEDTLAWMESQDLLESAPAYEDSVNPAFVPQSVSPAATPES
jgi:NitT/TauT family transport system substrate-binding protein